MLLESHMELFHHIQPPYRPFEKTVVLYCQKLAIRINNSTTKYILCHEMLQLEVIWIFPNDMIYIES